MSTKVIPLYLAQHETIVNVIVAFECVVHYPATLSDEELSCVIDPRIRNKRKLVMSHYNYKKSFLFSISLVNEMNLPLG
ncbi:hypothetical protein CLU79DRAFT_774486 [Phycomyces nitens]|nr:hypothetical protein CLU79DRAFT_774486 [Phycomyces nitens]